MAGTRRSRTLDGNLLADLKGDFAAQPPINILGDVGWQAYSAIIYLSFVTLTLFD